MLLENKVEIYYTYTLPNGTVQEITESSNTTSTTLERRQIYSNSVIFNGFPPPERQVRRPNYLPFFLLSFYLFYLPPRL